MPIVIVMIAVAVLFGALGLAYERQKRDERRQWAESTGDDGNRSEACAILRYPLPGPFWPSLCRSSLWIVCAASTWPSTATASSFGLTGTMSKKRLGASNSWRNWRLSSLRPPTSASGRRPYRCYRWRRYGLYLSELTRQEHSVAMLMPEASLPSARRSSSRGTTLSLSVQGSTVLT